MGQLLTALVLASGLVTSAAASESSPEPSRIVYWGNTQTGKSVRVYNTPDAEKKAEAQVKAIGGQGWVLLENSTKPGVGAAICQRQGPGVIQFYVAHGYPNAKQAVAAAKAKANGGGTFCSNALWKVNGFPLLPAGKSEDGPGTSNTEPVETCDRRHNAAQNSDSEAPLSTTKLSKEQCAEMDREARRAKNRYVCMCVRG